MSVDQCRAVPEQVTVNALSYYVAGSYQCPECGFVLHKSVLCMSDGNIYASIKQDYELCPNDGNPMQPVTYKDAYLAQVKASETIFKVIEHYQTASNDCECSDCDKLADKFRRFAKSEAR